MKNKITIFAVLVFAVFPFVSCETYKVADPETTAVSNMDGRYICFAYEPGDLTEPVTMFEVQATNTATNAKDKMLFTVVDYSPMNAGEDVYLEAVRFKVNCDTRETTFDCANAATSIPRTFLNRIADFASDGYFYNEYMQSSYAVTGTEPDYTVTITDGKVDVNGIDTATGYKTDGISFTYTRNHRDGSAETLIVRGMRNTGWSEDMEEFDNWIYENWGDIQ